MGEVVIIRHRFFPMAWRGPRAVALEQLQVVMDTANRHFSEHPERVLGGPTAHPNEVRRPP